MAKLRLLDLFSGIGGFSYAAEQLVGGFETIGFCEIEPYAQRILRNHWPHVPLYEDIRTLRGAAGTVDVITAGFPCQDLSSAGKQAGLRGERSGLFYEVIRLAREFRPQYLVLENVANLVSHEDGETFQEVLFQIARAGFDAEWAVVSARDVGACHLRKRVWIVAYATGKSGDDMRLEDAGKASKSESGDSDCADAAYTQGGRWGTGTGQAESKARHQGAGVSDCGAGSDAVYIDDQGLQGREPAGVREHAAEWTVWQGNPPGCGLSADWRGYVSQPVLCRGDDGLSRELDKIGGLINEANDSQSLSEADQFGREVLRKLWSRLQSSAAPSDLRGIGSPDSLPVMPYGDTCRGGDLGQWAERRQHVHQGLRDLWQDLSGESFQERQNMLKGLSERAGAVERFQTLALKRRVDRLKALGNAVVPQAAAIPLQRVIQLAGLDGLPLFE